MTELTEYNLGFPGGSDSKECACNAGDSGSISGSERSPGERNGYPVFIVALFTTANIWKQLICLSTDQWIKNTCYIYTMEYSIQFSCSVVSDSLRPHESQHTRPPCHHQHPEFTQTHFHRVSDAIQPSHPGLSPSPPAPNPSQHQSLFQ